MLRRPLARITRAARATTCGPVAEIVGHRRRHPHARAGRQRARFAAAVERLKPIGRHLAVAGWLSPLQLYSAGFDATWEIDLFGGTRRAVEAASAQAEAVDADLADTQVSIAAEVANAYIDLRDQQQRLALSRRTAELQQKMLEPRSSVERVALPPMPTSNA